MAKRETVKNINEETGELEDIHLHFKDGIPKDGSLVFSGDITEDIDHKNIRIYPKKKKEPEALMYEDPFWGTMVKVTKDRRHYSMNYVDGKAEFDTDTFYKHWNEIVHRLYWNCNVIIRRKPKIHPVQTMKDFQEICDVSKPTIYKFISECKSKGYIAKVEFNDNVFWVVNPKYERKGSSIPLKLMSLFQFGKDYMDDNLKMEEEVMEEEE